jgi:hypothetical protein
MRKLALVTATLVAGMTLAAGASADDSDRDRTRKTRLDLLGAYCAAPLPVERTPVESAPAPSEVKPVHVSRPATAPVSRPQTASAPHSRAASAPASAPASLPASGPSPAVLALREAKLRDPLALADALFEGGRLEEAAILYDQAATAKLPEQDWALFQLATCRAATQPAEGAVVYRRLLQEHPSSPLAQAARAQVQLIEWRASNNVEQVLKSLPPRP